MKKCPKGWICLKNISIIFILFFIFLIVYFFNLIFKNKIIEKYNNSEIVENINKKIIYKNLFSENNYNNSTKLNENIIIPLNKNEEEDVYLNPYSAPLKNTNYYLKSIFENNTIPIKNIPININTNIGALDVNYRQLGILTPLNSPNKNNILPLMGRPILSNRNKYQYYTISNQHNNVKLPISVKGKSGLNEYGVDELFNGDRVYVEGYNEIFKVTIYDNNTMKYIPFI